jgi:hypothetical protein
LSRLSWEWPTVAAGAARNPVVSLQQAKKWLKNRYQPLR